MDSACDPDPCEAEVPLFEPGDMLTLRQEVDFLEQFVGVLVQNVCPDGESVLCEMLVTAGDGRSWIGRVWQGYVTKVASEHT